MKTILAPVDFSPTTAVVVAEAASLARAVKGRVILLSVIQPPLVVTNENAPLLEDIAEITAASEKAAAKQLAKIKHKLERASIPAMAVQLNGAPIPLIIAQADKYKAEYIVMGSHGHTALYDLLVGGTTHGVLMRATCPVVIMPAAKAKTKRKK